MRGEEKLGRNEGRGKRLMIKNRRKRGNEKMRVRDRETELESEKKRFREETSIREQTRAKQGIKETENFRKQRKIGRDREKLSVEELEKRTRERKEQQKIRLSVC